MDKPAAPARRSSMIWLQGLACGALVMLARPVALLLGVLLCPTVIVAMLDRAAGKPVTRAVLLYGAAATAQPLLALLTGGRSMEQSLGLVSDPAVVAVAWAAQAAGWLLTELGPLLVRVLLDAYAAAESARLRAQRAALEAEWDLAPRAAAADAAPAPAPPPA